MRIGKFTGYIYEEDYDFSKCPECCHSLTGEIPIEEALKFKDKLRIKDLMDCSVCLGCPTAKEMNKF